MSSLDRSGKQVTFFPDSTYSYSGGKCSKSMNPKSWWNPYRAGQQSCCTIFQEGCFCFSVPRAVSEIPLFQHNLVSDDIQSTRYCP